LAFATLDGGGSSAVDGILGFFLEAFFPTALVYLDDGFPDAYTSAGTHRPIGLFHLDAGRPRRR
jgi:hypothetical protein